MKNPTISKTAIVAPTPLLALCEKATKGPYNASIRPGRFPRVVCVHGTIAEMDTAGAMLSNDEVEANAQLIARLSPEVVRAVYEALRKYDDAVITAVFAANSDDLSTIHDAVKYLRKVAAQTRPLIEVLDGTTAPSDLT